MQPRSSLPVLLAGLVLLAGCGGDETSDGDEVNAALQGFVSAVRDGDAASACDRLSATTLADLEVAGSCEDVMNTGFDLLGDKGVELPDYEIVNTAVDGETAEATLLGESTEKRIPLVREDGDWKVAGVTALEQFHPDSPLDSDSGEGEVGG